MTISGSEHQVGYDLPAELKCSFCRKRIDRSTPRAFTNGKFTCGECQYYLDRGETPPSANE